MKSAKIIAIFASVALIVAGMTATVSAKELHSGTGAEIVDPAYEIAYNPILQLSISGTTATCKSSVSGQSVKSITALEYFLKTLDFNHDMCYN